jgi:hypothetical protein
MNKLLTLSVVAILLSGCMATLDKIGGIGVIESNIDNFTGEKEVTITSAPTHNFKGDVATTRIGAAWYGLKPETIYLRVGSMSDTTQNDMYLNFESLDVNIDGVITTIKLGRTSHSSGGYNDVTNRIYTESNAGASVSLSFFEDMLNNENVKMRTYTNDWREDIDFQKRTNSLGGNLAKNTLLKFLDEVQKVKSK